MIVFEMFQCRRYEKVDVVKMMMRRQRGGVNPLW